MSRKGVSILILVICASMVLFSACSTQQNLIRKVGSLKTGSAYHVFVQGDYAFIASNEGVVIIDITRRDRPQKTALVELKEAAFGLYVQDDLLFIAGPADGLVIADISDKENPEIIGQYPAWGVNDVCVQDHLVYASTQQGDLQLINFEDPAEPFLVGTYHAQGGSGMRVVCRGDFAYYSTTEKGLDIVDVSDPASPEAIITVPRTYGVRDAQFVNNYLYVSCMGNGVRILDISNPLAPKATSTFGSGGEAWGISGDPNFLWVGDLVQGIELYDVSNPAIPRLIDHDEHYAPHHLFFDGDNVYIADQDRGFIVLDYPEP